MFWGVIICLGPWENFASRARKREVANIPRATADDNARKKCVIPTIAFNILISYKVVVKNTKQVTQCESRETENRQIRIKS